MPSWPITNITVVHAFFDKIVNDLMATLATPALLNTGIVPVQCVHKIIMLVIRKRPFCFLVTTTVREWPLVIVRETVFSYTCRPCARKVMICRLTLIFDRRYPWWERRAIARAKVARKRAWMPMWKRLGRGLSPRGGRMCRVPAYMVRYSRLVFSGAPRK